MKATLSFVAALLLASFTPASFAAEASLASALESIRAVGQEGAGNEDAASAWKALAQRPASDLTSLLEGMDGANALAANWLGAAAEAVADRTLAAGDPLPLAKLGAFLLDTSHAPQARVLAFDLIARATPEAAQEMIPGLLNDPSVTLRRKAVARLLGQAEELSQSAGKDAAGLLYRQALLFARDIDQIQAITRELEARGQTVDLPRHFGFLMNWQVIGPFHNQARSGFEAVFPPESGFDLNAAYQGKAGEVRWKPFTTSDKYGVVDINKALEPLKEVTAYAYAEFMSDSARNAELRLGCKNAWKIWFNGAFLFGRDEYHRGQQIDQYALPIQLREGVNTILVKVCQNEQTEEWTREWDFQLRICDATGTAILSTDRPETRPGTH